MNTTTTYRDDELLTWRITEYDTPRHAYGWIWDRGRGWGFWQDRGDRVLRVRTIAEPDVPAEYRAALVGLIGATS